jgi:signal transduction histidine kinase/HAMP domain-containing protein
MKITRKITFTFLLTFLISLTGLSTLSYWIAKARLTEQARCHLESVASIQERRAKQMIAQNLERLRLISSRTQLRHSLRDFVEEARPENQSMMNRILDDAKSSIPDLMDISVLTSDGRVVASTRREYIGSSYSDKEFFVRGKEGNCPDMFIVDEDQGLRGILSGPLFLENRPLGVIVIEYNVHNIISMVKDYSGLGKTGETLLAKRDKNGDAQFLTALRFDPNAALRRKLGKNELSAPITQALRRREDVFNKATDYRGKSVLAGTRYIEETDWGLVVKIDKAEALAPVSHLRNLMGITVFISSIVLIIVSFYITRSITGPVHELVKGAEEIGRGNFDYRTVVTSKDELGILSQAFNKMVENLREATASRDELNKEVTERKRTEEALRMSERELSIRNRIAEIFLTTSDEETYGGVLEVVLEAMQSKYGTFAYINEKGERVVPSMTRGIWDECKIPGKTIVFPRETWGDNLWARCLIKKKAITSNGPFKVPEGHIPITRALALPIIHRDEAIGNFMVGNKVTDYDEKDKAFLGTIADHIAPVLNARLQRDRQQKERKEAQQALQEAHNNLERRVEERTAELRRLSSQLLEVEEKERRRIAGDLHDSIGQSLTAIKFGLENALSRSSQDTAKESAELLEALIPVVQQASEEVRQIHTNLRPSLLDDLGIMSTISWFCRELEKVYSGIKIEKEMDMEEKEVPEPLKIVIFRVLQEALNNVVKHSKAALVRVFLKGRNGKLELVVEDNGQGFDVERRSSEKRFGLTSMKERTELSGGAFVIESIRGAGTVVRATWPI